MLQDAYDLHVLPAIIIVDPNTGQKMHERTGNVTVERFLEEIISELAECEAQSRDIIAALTSANGSKAAEIKALR